MKNEKLTILASEIVSAFVANHRISAQELPDLIKGVGDALWEAGSPTPKVEPEVGRAQARKVTRRRDGKVVQPDAKAPIIDEKQANKALIDVANDSFNEVVREDTISENQNIIGQDEQWDENGQPRRPEPMFE